MNPRYQMIVTTVVLALAVGVVFFIFNGIPEVSDNSQGVAMLENEVNKNSSAAFILPVSEPDYFPLRDFNIVAPIINARSAVLFDTRSSKFLYQKDMHKQLPIASLTKLMTAAVILENMDLNRTITVSVENLNVDGFGADLVRGEQIRTTDLLKLMLIKSSNDAALVFQTATEKEGIDLVSKMNEKARQIGMNETRFTNPAGLDDEAFSTATDLVKLVQYVSGQHKIIWDILKMPSVNVASVDGAIEHHVINTDQLLGKMPDIIGGKTGFTSGAMGTMILVVDVDSEFSNLIGIVLGSNDRFTEVKELIDWGRAAYRWK